ncbi:hypothetical protein AB0G79_04215 [Streptomyces sp. NPDC020807]|uniref:hypothetical protein n=1 Tax=Streptomyces sp. NPDC020807 TaxID=3155119 RepID=UPI0033DD39CA
MTQYGQGPEQQYPAAGGQPLPPAQPLPPEAVPGAADMQSTQYLPPIPAGPPSVPPQPGYGYPPQAPQVPDMQATQHIAPVPGAMPPPQPGYGYPPAQPAAGSDTQFLGTGPLPGQGQPHGASDATQYIAPVPPEVPGERQPLAEFDSLFRSETPQRPQAPQAPQGYQQQPPTASYPQQGYPQHQQQGYQPPQPPQQQYGYPGGRQDAYQDAYYDDEPERPRRKSPVALIAAVVVGCAVVGLGAGMMLSGGDEDDKGGQTVAASSSAPAAPDAKPGEATTEPAEEKPDPAEPQAKELDKLLGDSNSSRDSVISAVAAINKCTNLDDAAKDLRAAAKQRRGLVTRLEKLKVDKIPKNAALTSALTKAWRASASADDHYAAWADEMKDKKKCKGGEARRTQHLAEANEKSGEASAAKKQAAGLWNPTAEKYGLEKRSPTQL